jgi:hypothetical protein
MVGVGLPGPGQRDKMTWMVSHHASRPRCARPMRVPGHRLWSRITRPSSSIIPIQPQTSRLGGTPTFLSHRVPLALGNTILWQLRVNYLRTFPRQSHAPCTCSHPDTVKGLSGSLETRCEGSKNTRGDLR